MHREADAGPDGGGIQVVEGEPLGRGVQLPADATVHALLHAVFNQHLGHGDGGRADPLPVASVVGMRGLGAGLAGHQDDRLARTDVHRADRHLGVRIDAPYSLAELAQRGIADRLPDQGTFVVHAEQDPAASDIEHSAQRLATSGNLAGTALELQRLGLALGN